MTTPALSPDGAARLFPRGVGDPFCPRGGLIGTLTDHRLLWHIECVVSVSATNDTLRELARDLRRYLNVRCDHHWHFSEAEEDYAPAHWQCLWCNDVLWHPETPADQAQCCKPDDALEYWPTVAPSAASQEPEPQP